MLTFWWKYKKLKQIEVIEGLWNALDIFTGLDPRLLHVPKHELETLNVLFFLEHESAFEDLSFHYYFLKPVIEILRKRTVVLNIEYG